MIPVRFIAAATIVFVIATGCSRSAPSDAPPKPREHWPTQMTGVRFAWTADPGIDLLMQPAVVVRAYIESTSLATFGNSLDYLYPGFDHAVAPNQPVGSQSSTVALWPDPFPDSPTMVGTDQYHILSVVKSGRDVTAIVCHWAWTLALPQPNGLYRIKPFNSGPTTSIAMERLNLIAPVDSDGGKLAPQKGPSSYATTDIFGGWRVVGKLEASSWLAMLSEWPEFNQDLDACAARAPESIERREYLTSADRPRSDFPTLPASPGWPAQSQ